jgi:pimeloyl-ACP methyl ester carboxylesterase
MRIESVVREPESSAKPDPILFIHGMWHGAWCWEEHFLPYFAENGYVCRALDLRGHGSSEGRDRLRWTSIADYVDDVVRVVREMGAPPIVVGHSMGGMVVQKYLEENSAPAGILLAPAPPRGVLLTALRILRRRPRAFGKCNLTLSMYPIVETPELAREAFFSPDVPEERLKGYARLLQDDSYRAFLDMLVLNLPRTGKVKTPMLVLGAEEDTIFSRGQIESAARAYGTHAEFFPNTAHDMMLEPAWRAVADRMLEWLDQRDLQ